MSKRSITISMPLEVFQVKLVTAFRIAESLFKDSGETVYSQTEIEHEIEHLLKSNMTSGDKVPPPEVETLIAIEKKV